MQQLRKLELYGINPYNVRGLRHLKDSSLDSLSLGFTKDDMDSDFRIDLIRSDRLKLYGHVGILEVLPYGTTLTDLTLEIETSLTEDNMMRIRGESRALRTLRLHFHTRQEGGKLKFDANNIGDFPLLEVLEISSLRTSLDVEFAREMLKSLVVLKCVGSLKIRPGGLHVLSSLKEVWVEGRSLKAAMDQVLRGHPNKPNIMYFPKWQYIRDPKMDVFNQQEID